MKLTDGTSPADEKPKIQYGYDPLDFSEIEKKVMFSSLYGGKSALFAMNQTMEQTLKKTFALHQDGMKSWLETLPSAPTSPEDPKDWKGVLPQDRPETDVINGFRPKLTKPNKKLRAKAKAAKKARRKNR